MSVSSENTKTMKVVNEAKKKNNAMRKIRANRTHRSCHYSVIHYFDKMLIQNSMSKHFYPIKKLIVLSKDIAILSYHK